LNAWDDAIRQKANLLDDGVGDTLVSDAATNTFPFPFRLAAHDTREKTGRPDTGHDGGPFAVVRSVSYGQMNSSRSGIILSSSSLVFVGVTRLSDAFLVRLPA